MPKIKHTSWALLLIRSKICQFLSKSHSVPQMSRRKPGCRRLALLSRPAGFIWCAPLIGLAAFVLEWWFSYCLLHQELCKADWEWRLTCTFAGTSAPLLRKTAILEQAETPEPHTVAVFISCRWGLCHRFHDLLGFAQQVLKGHSNFVPFRPSSLFQVESEDQLLYVLISVGCSGTMWRWVSVFCGRGTGTGSFKKERLIEKVCWILVMWWNLVNVGVSLGNWGAEEECIVCREGGVQERADGERIPAHHTSFLNDESCVVGKNYGEQLCLITNS